MKMTVKQALNALAGVIELGRKETDYETARKILAWKKVLTEEMQSASSFEERMVEKYSGVRKGKNIQFPDEASASAFRDEMESMKQTEIEVPLTEIDLSKIGGGKTVMMKPELWEVLEPILLKAEETA